MKPTNILVLEGEAGPIAKVLDFGLAQEKSRSGEPDKLTGTLAYMAPELLVSGGATEASDLYAVGVLACEMLTGRHPFDADGDPARLIAQVLGQPPDLSGVEPKLREVLGRALSKSPAGRPADAGTLMRELAQAANVSVPKESTALRDSFLMAARFTGRETELLQLRQALESARNGQGSAWLVGGESGVGKSRLLEELRTLALVGGMQVLRGHAVPVGGAAYQIWHNVLRGMAIHQELSDGDASVIGAVVPDLERFVGHAVTPAETLDARNGQLRLLSVLTQNLTQSNEPVLILLEDLHWEDAGSVAILNKFCESLGERRLLVVACYRPEEAAHLPEQLTSMHLLKLGRLNRPQMERLCESMLGTGGLAQDLVELIERETEGNTYFIVEVIRVLAEEAGSLDEVGRRRLPEQVLAGGIEQVLRRRIDCAPPETQPLLRLAALAGRQLDLAVLRVLLPHADELLPGCLEAGILERQGQSWQFSHDKLREFLIRVFVPADVAELHGWLMETIEAVYPNSPLHASTIAYHAREAGLVHAAAQYYARAGEAALMAGALPEAIGFLEQAAAFQAKAAALPIGQVAA